MSLHALILQKLLGDFGLQPCWLPVSPAGLARLGDGTKARPHHYPLPFEAWFGWRSWHIHSMNWAEVYIRSRCFALLFYAVYSQRPQQAPLTVPVQGQDCASLTLFFVPLVGQWRIKMALLQLSCSQQAYYRFSRDLSRATWSLWYLFLLPLPLAPSQELCKVVE